MSRVGNLRIGFHRKPKRCATYTHLEWASPHDHDHVPIPLEQWNSTKIHEKRKETVMMRQNRRIHRKGKKRREEKREKVIQKGWELEMEQQVLLLLLHDSSHKINTFSSLSILLFVNINIKTTICCIWFKNL